MCFNCAWLEKGLFADLDQNGRRNRQHDLHVFDWFRNGPIQDSRYLHWVHAYPWSGDHVANECHVVLVELSFCHLGVESVVSQNLEDGADGLDVGSGILRKGDNIVEDADRRWIQVLSGNVIHKMVEHCRCISRPLRTHLILKMSFPASECCISLIPCLYSNMVISIA